MFLEIYKSEAIETENKIRREKNLERVDSE